MKRQSIRLPHVLGSWFLSLESSSRRMPSSTRWWMSATPRSRRAAGKLSQAEHDYNSLKMAKMMTISDADMEATQRRRQAHPWCQHYNATEQSISRSDGRSGTREITHKITYLWHRPLGQIPRRDGTIVSQASLINDIVNSYSKIFKGRKSDKRRFFTCRSSISPWDMRRSRVVMILHLITIFSPALLPRLRTPWSSKSVFSPSVCLPRCLKDAGQ